MPKAQLENGYIKIACELGDEFSRLHLSGNEWKCLWTVIRKTWGWHKKTDAISITQFEKSTNLHRWRVTEAIKGLVTKNVILVTKTVTGNVYQIQSDHSRWGSHDTVTSHENRDEGSHVFRSKVVTKTVNTKDIYTKDNLKIIPKPQTSKPQTSKNSLIRCSPLELQQIAADLNVPLPYIEDIHNQIMDKIADGIFQNKKYGKTVYYTLKNWARIRIKEDLIKLKGGKYVRKSPIGVVRLSK